MMIVQLVELFFLRLKKSADIAALILYPIQNTLGFMKIT